MAGDAGSEAAADDSRFRPLGGKHAAPCYPPLFNIAHIVGIAGSEIRVIRRPHHATIAVLFSRRGKLLEGFRQPLYFMARAGAMFGCA
jgi:hypothetical protein